MLQVTISILDCLTVTDCVKVLSVKNRSGWTPASRMFVENSMSALRAILSHDEGLNVLKTGSHSSCIITSVVKIHPMKKGMRWKGRLKNSDYQ